MPAIPKRQNCPFCGKNNLSLFFKFDVNKTPEALLKYQISEGNLTKEGAHEPILICSDCNGLSRRDVIPINLYEKCYTARLEKESYQEIISHIRAENSEIFNPDSKYKKEISFFDKNVDPSSELT